MGRKVQHAFITRFNEIRSEGQAAITLQYARLKKYELMEDYYDWFLRLCVVIPQQPDDICLREALRKGLQIKMKMAIISMLKEH
jgi:hypothetical protein